MRHNGTVSILYTTSTRYCAAVGAHVAAHGACRSKLTLYKLHIFIPQSCDVDRYDEGGVPPYALDIMVVHYLQCVRQLPVLYMYDSSVQSGERNVDWTRAVR